MYGLNLGSGEKVVNILRIIQARREYLTNSFRPKHEMQSKIKGYHLLVLCVKNDQVFPSKNFDYF